MSRSYICRILFERSGFPPVKASEFPRQHRANSKTMPVNKSKAGKIVPQISDAEWRVMKVLWTKAPQTTNEVVDALDGETDWKPKTIHTLLSRLTQKGALIFEKKGREYLFKPAVTAEECEHEVASSFLDRFFDGDLAPFLARFVEGRKLKPTEIEKLKRILDGGAP